MNKSGVMGKKSSKVARTTVAAYLTSWLRRSPWARLTTWPRFRKQ
jgi:hypothetical protein